MTENGVAPNPLDRQDASALIGMLAVLEGSLLTGDLDPFTAERLTRRLASDGLLGPDAGVPEFRLALADLNRRIRYVLGEHDEPPLPTSRQTALLFGFASRQTAQAFADAAGAAGEHATTPVEVDGRAYDDSGVGWQVAVRTSELPLSEAFDAHRVRLRRLAAEHGGSDGGWAGTPL